MKARCAVLTHRGLKRTSNEDSLVAAGWVRSASLNEPRLFSVETPLTVLFALADGLGGHAAGEIASLLCLTRLDAALSEKQSVSEAQVLGEIERVHSEILAISQSSPDLRGMGTTVAGILLSEAGIQIFNVGDSRVYRREEQYLQQLSKDDRMADKTYGDVAAPNTSNALLQCLGGQTQKIEPHIMTIGHSSKNETFLLCTDGLYDFVNLDDIESSMSDDHENWLRGLFEKACKAGGGDNITILALQVMPDVAADTA